MINFMDTPGLKCVPAEYRPAVAGIEQSETQGFPWIATDTHTLKVYRFKNEKDAYNGIAKLIREGHHLAVGIAQIKVSEFNAMHVTLSSAISPCSAARSVSNAIQMNLNWAGGHGYLHLYGFEAAASGYTSGSLIPPSKMVVGYVKNTVYVAQQVAYDMHIDPAYLIR